MGNIADQLTEDLKTAMRAKDTVALNTLRALKSAIKNAAIEKGGADAELDGGEICGVIRKQIKQRQDSLSQFKDAGRDDLAEREESELAILERYLPDALSEEESAALVDAAINEIGATSKADMGKVMKLVQERATGRADGKTLSQLVMQRLS